jgi:hypothetical protein
MEGRATNSKPASKEVAERGSSPNLPFLARSDDTESTGQLDCFPPLLSDFTTSHVSRSPSRVPPRLRLSRSVRLPWAMLLTH